VGGFNSQESSNGFRSPNGGDSNFGQGNQQSNMQQNEYGDEPGFFDGLKTWWDGQNEGERLAYGLGAAFAVGFPVIASVLPQVPQESVTQQTSTVAPKATSASSQSVTPKPAPAASNYNTNKPPTPAPAPTPMYPARQPSLNSEARLDNLLNDVKKGYVQLGDEVRRGDMEVMDESKTQLSQAKIQKKAAEQALAAVKEDKRRLEAERARLDASLEDANKLYVELAEQSKQQLANLKIQEKKAEEAQQFIAAKKAQLENNKASFEVAARNANPSYLEDVQRQFAERESQVKATYSLLEEESKKQLAKVQAREVAAERALEKISQEKEKLEIQKAQLGASLEEVNARYSLLIKQAELQLALVQAEEKVAEDTLAAIMNPQKAKEILQQPTTPSAAPKRAMEAPKAAAEAPKPSTPPAAKVEQPKQTPVLYPAKDATYPLDRAMF